MRFRLKQEHINDLLLIEDKFKKRDYIQDLGTQIFRTCKGKLICTWATAIGKTVLGIKIMKKIRTNSDEEIHVTVPSDILKEQWEAKISAAELKNVFVYTIHSYLKQTTVIPRFLICDECHIGLANEEGTLFNKINDVPAKFKLYLSATLKVDQLKYLETKGLKNEFKIGIDEAIVLDLVPPLSIYNVYVPFTLNEKREYEAAVFKENRALDYFSFHNVLKLGAKPPVIPGVNYKESTIIFYSYLRARSKRLSLVAKAENKAKILPEIIDLIKERKLIIFSTTQKQSEEIHKIVPDSVVYHAGIKPVKKAKENYDKFINNEILKISSVGKLIAGIDDQCTDAILRVSFFSAESTTKQSLGRILRVDPDNPNKTGIMINLVTEPFISLDEKSEGEVENKTIVPCDNTWIHIGLRYLDYEFVTLNELKKILN